RIHRGREGETSSNGWGRGRFFSPARGEGRDRRLCAAAARTGGRPPESRLWDGAGKAGVPVQCTGLVRIQANGSGVIPVIGRRHQKRRISLLHSGQWRRVQRPFGKRL